MAYSGLYQHFPGYTGPASPHGHSSPPAGPANNNNTSSCSPAKSEPGAGEGPSASGQPSHSPGGYKWSPASGTGGQGAADTGHRGAGSVTDILSPFQSYDQHHQVIIIIIIDYFTLIMMVFIFVLNLSASLAPPKVTKYDQMVRKKRDAFTNWHFH